MSTISMLHDFIDVCCPYCDEFNEIADIDVSIIVENTDVGRKIDECAFVHECEDCGRSFKINPELIIEVREIK